MKDNDKLVEYSVVEKHLNVSRSTVVRLVENGLLDATCVGVKPNTGKRIYWSSVLAFKESRRMEVQQSVF